MKKLILSVIGGCLLLVLVASIIVNLNYTGLNFIVYGAPDSYGNAIVWLCVYQHNGSHWNLLLNHTSDSNWTQRVTEDYAINITVKWRLNATLAASENEAVSYTKVLMNISTVWTNEELNNTASSSNATYYYGVETAFWNQSGKPAAGVTYDVATKFWAYI